MPDAAAAFSSAAFTACPLNVRVGANSPSLCPTICSVMYTGMNFLPLCTAIVCPTSSGRIVERRDHVFMTFFSFLVFSPSTFKRRWSSINGPFFSARGTPSPFPLVTCRYSSLFFNPAQFHPLRPAHLSESANRSRNTMRDRAERANKSRSLRVRNLVHNHAPARTAQTEQHLRRWSEFRRNFPGWLRYRFHRPAMRDGGLAPARSSACRSSAFSGGW